MIAAWEVCFCHPAYHKDPPLLSNYINTLDRGTMPQVNNCFWLRIDGVSGCGSSQVWMCSVVNHNLNRRIFFQRNQGQASVTYAAQAAGSSFKLKCNLRKFLFSSPLTPLLSSSFPFIVEHHPAHPRSSFPGYIISWGRETGVFPSNTLTAGPKSSWTKHMCKHTYLVFHTHFSIIHKDMHGCQLVKITCSHIQTQQQDPPSCSKTDSATSLTNSLPCWRAGEGKNQPMKHTTTLEHTHLHTERALYIVVIDVQPLANWVTQNTWPNGRSISLINYGLKPLPVCQREPADPQANGYLLEATVRPLRGCKSKVQVREGGERGGKGCPRVITKLQRRYLEDCVFDSLGVWVCVSI